MSKSLSFRLQLSSIMEITTKTAIDEICKIVDSDFAFLRQELSRVMSENTVLKDKMLCLGSERQDEGARITKEARAGSKTLRSICVQTEDGPQPSIKGIFGKEWCSSLWDRRNESREDEQAIDVDLYTVTPYKHEEKDLSNLVLIKEESFEVDTYPSYTGKTPQVSRRLSSAYETSADHFVSGEFSEISEIQNTSSDSSDKHSTKTTTDDTVDRLIAPIDDPLDFDGQCVLNQFSVEHNNEFPSEAQDDGEAQETCADAATTTEHCEKRFRVQKLPNNFSCYDSGRVFVRQNAARNRLRKHRFSKLKPNEKFRCEVCGRCFHSNTNLTVHYLVHTGERPYKCSFCGKGFSQKGNLQTHERIHRGERPFSCATCGRSFTQKVCLRNHERIHRGERPFTCITCGKGFTQKVTLQQHLSVHDRTAKPVRKKPRKSYSDINYSFM
ncbi:zinc finger and SCAN domain-containing protein 12 [Megalobrama amblycephala]|uniref:zinc finger and SCAN domain-containing protein 12 n=1 Tax=Megalobrama amblycephala TaxID=75352 RepID=UPI002013E0FF|nr:zinc finger and SCAN domain-containing protein 12 [Megalobrama amblycephala]